MYVGSLVDCDCDLGGGEEGPEEWLDIFLRLESVLRL